MAGEAVRVDRRLAVLAHTSFFVAPVFVPLGLYLAYYRRRPWVAAHAVIAFNFQLTYVIALFALVGVASLLGGLGPLAIVAALAVWIMGTAAAIGGIVRAASDELRPYPASIPFLPAVVLPVSGQ